MACTRSLAKRRKRNHSMAFPAEILDAFGNVNDGFNQEISPPLKKTFGSCSIIIISAYKIYTKNNMSILLLIRLMTVLATLCQRMPAG